LGRHIRISFFFLDPFFSGKDILMMDSLLFMHRFRAASAAARRMHLEQTGQELPEALLFQLNPFKPIRFRDPPELDPPPGCSPGGKDPHGEFLTAGETMAQLWRGGLVPEWVDFSVKGWTDEATIIEVWSSGLFLGNEDHLMHQREGWPPFHVLGNYSHLEGKVEPPEDLRWARKPVPKLAGKPDQECGEKPGGTSGEPSVKKMASVMMAGKEENLDDLEIGAEVIHALIFCARATTDQVLRFVDPVREQLQTLMVAGTAVDNTIFLALPSFSKLRTLNLKDTQVTQEAIDRCSEEHPYLLLDPRPTGWLFKKNNKNPGTGGVIS
jgi:hypothetical protein